MYNKRYENILLSKLRPEDRLLLESHMEKIKLPFWRTLEFRGQPIEFVYFLETGSPQLLPNCRGAATSKSA